MKKRIGCQPKGLSGHLEKVLLSHYLYLNMKIKTVCVGVMNPVPFKLPRSKPV